MYDSFFGMPLLGNKYDFSNKRKCVETYMKYMYVRTMSMFEYTNLPDSIPKRFLELYLQNNGHAAIINVNDELYATFGNWGGEPNPYYVPTEYVIANPYLNVFKVYTIDKDCVIIGNDSLYVGMQKMFNKYAQLLTENDISFRIADINARIVSIINANDENTRASAEKYLHDVENGNLGVIQSNGFLDELSFTTQPFSSRNTSGALTDLIEYHQYLRASWFNEIGLNANYNMKRESINSNESQLNDDMLLPLIDDMLYMRKLGLDKVNKMFGTNIDVEFSSSWKNNEIELTAQQSALFEINNDESSTTDEPDITDDEPEITDDESETVDEEQPITDNQDEPQTVSDGETNIEININAIGGDNNNVSDSEDENSISTDDNG